MDGAGLYEGAVKDWASYTIRSRQAGEVCEVASRSA